MDNELKHWGVKGMKWGVRRYQNKDGSLTPAGQKRYDRDVRENNAKKKDNRIVIDGPDPHRWATEDIRRTKNVVDGSKAAVGELQKLNNTYAPKSKKQSLDLSNMTDKEMRDKINRTMLERQYNDMFAPETTSKGREFANKALDVAKDVLVVGSTALSIALAIKELKGGN